MRLKYNVLRGPPLLSASPVLPKLTPFCKTFYDALLTRALMRVESRRVPSCGTIERRGSVKKALRYQDLQMLDFYKFALHTWLASAWTQQPCISRVHRARAIKRP
jgi:hypothetical protein